MTIQAPENHLGARRKATPRTSGPIGDSSLVSRSDDSANLVTGAGSCIQTGARLRELTAGRGVEPVIDCVAAELGAKVARNLAPAGTVLVYGATACRITGSDERSLHHVVQWSAYPS